MPFVGHADLRFEPLPARAVEPPTLRDLWELRPTWPAAFSAAAASVCVVVMDGSAWLGGLGVLTMPLRATANWSLSALRWCGASAHPARSDGAVCRRGARLGTLESDAHEGLLGSYTALLWPWSGIWLAALGIWQLLPVQHGLHIAALTPAPVARAASSAVAFRNGQTLAARHAAVHAAPLLAMFGIGLMQMVWMGLHMVLCACDAAWPRGRLIRARAVGVGWQVVAAAPALRLS